MALSENLLHGGDLISASARYNIPVESWLDLSTGLNPVSYPVEGVDPLAFQRLPYIQPEFLAAAARYYSSDQLLPVNGSQPVIQVLPKCVEKLPVLLPAVGYDEHRHSWQKNGNPLVFYPAFDAEAARVMIETALLEGEAFHLLVINPNNPSGLRFSPHTLAEWSRQMAPGSYLIVDEAFIDTDPEASVLAGYHVANMVVLRSFGKFFGLAGLRLGFVFAEATLREALQQRLGLWQVNGVAQSLATKALSDDGWQMRARQDIHLNAEASQRLLAPLMSMFKPLREIRSALFSSWLLSRSEATGLQRYLATHGILVRVIVVDKHHSLLRIGILDRNDLNAMERLEQIVLNYAQHLTVQWEDSTEREVADVCE
ncbi:aminotransferase class I/II-fold pyridoxal phosphate-dependent enzyme [Pontibacterium sp. N1Y112]|uniref:Aminotransferase n=1 Tax=Pontibacterium sinense TaxID=2781979 RepID=A0A8J7K925_9GAMM|nr:aminotransferase class I/II-fold pyridoxal phosphate-dependent enzyme [Pontibacterium sinense]